MYYVVCLSPAQGTPNLDCMLLKVGQVSRHGGRSRAVIIGARGTKEDIDRLALHAEKYYKVGGQTKSPVPDVRSFYLMLEYFWSPTSKPTLIERTQMVTEGTRFDMAAKGWYTMTGPHQTVEAAKESIATARQLVLAELQRNNIKATVLPQAVRELYANLARNSTE